MASFDRSIPPGGEGKITLAVNTQGYQGDVGVTAVVYTNDPKMARVTLTIRAFVQVPITMQPRYVQINGREDATITRSVEIKGELDKDLTLEPSQFSLEGRIAYKIEEMEKGRRFWVHFTNIPGARGAFRGFLNLKTNYEEKPVITIRIAGNLRKAPQPQGEQSDGSRQQ